MKLTENQIELLIKNGLECLKSEFFTLDNIAVFNQEKVLCAFREEKLALRHFNGTSGYGYDDEGRDTLKKVFSRVFNTESAVVSPSIASGTHALALGLFALCKNGTKVLSVSGKPYDTLEEVIWSSPLSLTNIGVNFDCIDLVSGEFDKEKIVDYIKNNSVDILYIQRSRGYEERRAFSVYAIGEIIKLAKQSGFSGVVFVDNCYGEFVEKLEPTDVGADIVCGSLIKNIGGGLAPTGGYLAGKRHLIEKVEQRLTAPGIGGEVGSYAFGYQYFYQGLFLAPHTVNQALKGSLLLGLIMSDLGYETMPKAKEIPFDITRSIKLGDKEKLIKFIRSVQAVSPVDSFLTCEPWDMPGYQDPVIMAAGCFVQGASIELSADAPIREPYIAYVQGGLTLEHIVIAIKQILANL